MEMKELNSQAKALGRGLQGGQLCAGLGFLFSPYPS